MVCRSPLFGAGHADVMSSSMEEIIEEEVIASGSGTYCDNADGKTARRSFDPPCVEPLSLVIERTLPATSGTEPKMEPLQTFYSHDDENYYLEPRPPRNADSAPPSFGGT